MGTDFQRLDRNVEERIYSPFTLVLRGIALIAAFGLLGYACKEALVLVCEKSTWCSSSLLYILKELFAWILVFLALWCVHVFFTIPLKAYLSKKSMKKGMKK